MRLASREDAGLLLVGAPRDGLDGESASSSSEAPCDVAMLVAAGGALRPGPVVVPFGAAWHDWAALELGAWVARATGAPLRLIGAAGDGPDGRDASRLLADASLIVQRATGVVAEPLLAGARPRAACARSPRGPGCSSSASPSAGGRRASGRVRDELVETPPGADGARPARAAPGRPGAARRRRRGSAGR